MNTFWAGVIVLVIPFVVVLLWESWREKVQNTWLDGYSAGYQDGDK